MPKYFCLICESKVYKRQACNTIKLNIKTSIGVYCDKVIYSVMLSDTGNIKVLKVEKHEGRLRHFKFIKHLKSLVDVDLCVIYENDEAKPIVNYLRREKKREYITIDFSPLPDHPNYKENPDLPTLVRKLAYRKKLNDIVFSDDQTELKNQIERLCETNKTVHMRTLDGFVLAFMAAAHGIFILEE